MILDNYASALFILVGLLLLLFSYISVNSRFVSRSMDSEIVKSTVIMMYATLHSSALCHIVF